MSLGPIYSNNKEHYQKAVTVNKCLSFLHKMNNWFSNQDNGSSVPSYSVQQSLRITQDIPLVLLMLTIIISPQLKLIMIF